MKPLRELPEGVEPVNISEMLTTLGLYGAAVAITGIAGIILIVVSQYYFKSNKALRIFLLILGIILFIPFSIILTVFTYMKMYNSFPF
jgi:hypothetical protein